MNNIGFGSVVQLFHNLRKVQGKVFRKLNSDLMLHRIENLIKFLFSLYIYSPNSIFFSIAFVIR